MNRWVYLVQTTTKVILHISIEFLEHFFEVKELLDWTYGWNWSKAPPKSFYTSPLSSEDMFLETTELLDRTHG